MTEDHARRLETHVTKLQQRHADVDPRIVATLVMVAYHQMAEEQPDADVPTLARDRADEELQRMASVVTRP